jgi:hypothetical protein
MHQRSNLAGTVAVKGGSSDLAAIHTQIMSAIVDVFLVVTRKECLHLNDDKAGFILWFLLGSKGVCMLTRTCTAYARLSRLPCSMPRCPNMLRTNEIRALTMNFRVLRGDDDYWSVSDTSSEGPSEPLCKVCVFQHNNRECWACKSRYRMRPCPVTGQFYGTTVLASLHDADCACCGCYNLVRSGFAYPAA